MKFNPKGLLYYISVYIIVFNILDFLNTTFIEHSSYHFELLNDLLIPVALAIIVFFLRLFMTNRKR